MIMNNMPRLLLIATSVLTTFFLIFPTPLVMAQNSRLELGRRVRRLEQTWELSTPRQRAEAIPPLKQAVSSFFSLRLSDAGKMIDDAWQKLRDTNSDAAFVRSVSGLTLLVSPVLADTNVDKIKIEVASFYKTDQKPPQGTVIHLKIRLASGVLLPGVTKNMEDGLASFSWENLSLPEGDHDLIAEFQHQESRFALPPVKLSRVENLEARLQKLEAYTTTETSQQAGEATNQVLQRCRSATIKNEVNLLRQMLSGKSQEADFPMAQRLAFCETLGSPELSVEAPSPLLEPGQQFWLTLASENRTLKTRIQLPDLIEGPMPVLFVFHGAGGSENMFFENYGAGRVVREASSRGWLVVAPGQSLFGMALDIDEMLVALKSFIDCDRNYVMLLGHSMGAMQVQQQVKKHPKLPIAAVAIGGGRTFVPNKSGPGLKAKWYVSAGRDDFGRSGAMLLHRSLEAQGFSSQYSETDPAEHLTCVQASVEPVFQFLDRTLRERQDQTIDANQ